MKKIFISSIVLIVTIITVFFAYNTTHKNTYLYINQYSNTEVLPYINKTIKNVDWVVKKSIFSLKFKYPEMKLIYSKPYGSGFLKHNHIPNDLDYCIGIYLGKYEYDGHNAVKIAYDIDNKITDLYIKIFENANKSNSLTTDDTNMNEKMLYNNPFRKLQHNTMSKGIRKIAEHKPYILLNGDMNYVLGKDEIFYDDMSMMTFLTYGLRYNENMPDFLREVQLCTSWYVDIKYGDEVIRVKVLPITFKNIIFKADYSSMVSMFYGKDSEDWLNEHFIEVSDDDFIKLLFKNFEVHFDRASLETRDIKVFKRILQCLDLINPLIDSKDRVEITKIIEHDLNNTDTALINDYKYALANYIKITQSPSLFFKLRDENKLKKHIATIDVLLNKFEENKVLSSSDIELLKKFNKIMSENINTVTTDDELVKYNHYLRSLSKFANRMLSDKVKANTDYKEIKECIATFNEIVTKSGFHRISFLVVDENHILIMKDSYTSKVKDLREMAIQNDFPDVNYALANPNKFQDNESVSAMWVRYNPTAEQEKYYKEVKRKLLEHRQDFAIKRVSIYNK